ncbi:MAG: HAMP domain-containing histidine kinase [Nitrospirae bacterium]|nr:HAMP domain-containing histidine kinase [Candidatus Manganitrophaceae bacterium]
MARVGAHLELARLRREALQNEQRLRAEAERANRFKSEFVSQIFHDLRTPLNAIIGYTALLRDGTDGPIGEEEKPALERIQRNADDLLQPVNNILDLARMESGKLPLDLAPIAIAPLLEDLSLEMKPLADRKGLSIRRDGLASALPSIVSDPLRVKQIVVNLLTNAIKFTEQGVIVISARDLPATEEIEMAVSDTGVGIAPEALSRVFESFYQAEESRTSGGSGLGLTIVKELVTLLKGRVSIRSEYGKGATFTVSLPYRLEKELEKE